MDKQSIQFLCGAFLLLHSQPALTNAGSSEGKKKFDTKPKNKKKLPGPIAESQK
jgi:hypothetical protein